MSRRRAAKKREVIPDRRYNSALVSKFVSMMMISGKKFLAEKIFYSASEIAAAELSQDPSEVLDNVVDKVRPLVEVCSRRVGGSTYQIPVEVRDERSLSIAMKWLINSSLKRGKGAMKDKLAGEFVDVLNGRGASIKLRDDTHKMAESNRAFAHFRW